jgi:hypothetical protein
MKLLQTIIFSLLLSSVAVASYADAPDRPGQNDNSQDQITDDGGNLKMNQPDEDKKNLPTNGGNQQNSQNSKGVPIDATAMDKF